MRSAEIWGIKDLANARSCVDVTDRVEAQAALHAAQEAELKTLRGLLPICASCKNIRDDKGYWNQIEVYVSARSPVEFTHSLCPACIKKLFPEYCNEE